MLPSGLRLDFFWHGGGEGTSGMACVSAGGVCVEMCEDFEEKVGVHLFAKDFPSKIQSTFEKSTRRFLQTGVTDTRSFDMTNGWAAPSIVAPVRARRTFHASSRLL